MKRIGIVVCNYNKCEFVIPCLDSIFASSVKDFDVYVVDNASTDDSVEKIRETYPTQVTLLVNKENLGGSGGFNTGLREVLKKDYEYVMCVDNDILMEKDTIEKLMVFLDTNKDVGMVGSKICFMDDPDRIQCYGNLIDFETYDVNDLHRGLRKDADLPDVQYCNFVPACSLMARTEAVRKAGIMPEDNFIYWDDMEWGHCFGLNGYKVAAINDSVVYHKGGKNTNPTTFQKYYMIRNRIHFFMKYVEEGRREHFVKTILSELYRSICGCYLKKEYNMVKGFMYAYDDGIHDVRGKADPSRILPRIAPDRFDEIITGDEKITILFDGNYRCLSSLKQKLESKVKTEQITVVADQQTNINDLQEQYPDCKIVAYGTSTTEDVLFQQCEHIFKVKEAVPNAVCVDQWMNLLITDEDFGYAKNYEANQKFFLMCQESVMMGCME